MVPHLLQVLYGHVTRVAAAGIGLKTRRKIAEKPAKLAELKTTTA